MADVAHDFTDDEIERLQKRFRRVYGDAAKEMREKLDNHMAAYEKKNDEWKSKVKSGEATQDEYDAWLKDMAQDRQFVQGMADRLAQDAVNADKLAMDYINDSIPQVYAENANYAAYEIEREIGYDTHSFDLYDESTVRRLIADEDTPLLPKPNVDERKDHPWNQRKFSGAIVQSVLQGESIPNTAKRLRMVLNMDERAATRAARTAMTGAENAGRVDSYKRAERIGIKLEQQWLATFDERTRISHRELHGQHKPVGEYFIASKTSGAKLLYPGDPSAPSEEVYNCRCTLVAWFPDIEQEEKPLWTDWKDGTTYDDWKGTKRQDEIDEPIDENELKAAFDIWALSGATMRQAQNGELAENDFVKKLREQADLIDRYVLQTGMEDRDGWIYRGMYDMSPYDISKFTDVGSTVTFGGTTSWSEDLEIAKRFGQADNEGSVSIVFRGHFEDGAAKISQFLSLDEKEFAVSKMVEAKIDRVDYDKKRRTYYVTVRESRIKR